MPEQPFSIDDLLKKLQNDTEAKPSSRIKKLFMNAPDNVGASISVLPILSEGEIYRKLDSVREIQSTSSFFKDGESETWCRLLDRSAYGAMTTEESDLWLKTKDVIEQLIEVADDFYTCRFRRYVLLPVYILEFVNPNGVKDAEKTGLALLIFPSHSPIKALKDAIDMMVTNMKGNQWMPLVFSPSLKGRKGALSIKFSKSTSNKGYDTSMSFAMNSEWSQVVDPEKDYSEGITIDPIREFLGWQVQGNKLFNVDYVKELKENAEKMLKSYNGEPEDNKSEGTTEEAKVEPASTATPAPQPETPAQSPAAPF
jgi:hypothetical protein